MFPNDSEIWGGDADGDELKEECGVIGIHAPDQDAARLAFFALYTLQHRGQEAAGMASVDHGVAHVHKGQGLVPAVFNEDNLSTLKGEFAIGHTRYSTTGGTGLRNAQPHVIETIDGPLGIAHNGNLVNAHILRRQLLERGVGLQTSSDTEVMIHLLTGGSGDWMNRIKMLMAQAEGAFALTIITGDRSTASGIRGVSARWSSASLRAVTCWPRKPVRSPPSVPNWSTNSHRAKSADWTPTATASSKVRCPSNTRFCTFEQIYFSRPDSIYEGKLVHSTRQRLGRELAREAPVEPTSSSPCPTRAPRTPSGTPRKRVSRTPRDSPRTAMSGARSSSPPRSFASRRSG